jgi:hypothetical protein
MNTPVGAKKKIRNSVPHRIAQVANHETYRRVLNNFHEEDGLVFGNVCLFDPGQLQALIELGQEPDEATLAQVLEEAWPIAEKAAPPGTEYLHGITYWMVTGDHFYQIQHPALQAKAMEEYFTWLLRDQAKAIGNGYHVELQATFDRAQVGDDLSDISSVEIGGLVPETVHDERPATTTVGKPVEVIEHATIGDRLAQTFGQARQILIDLFGPMEAQKIIESVPPQASLEVKVNIGYRAKRRKFQKEFMGNLAAGLRNIPDGELRVRGRDGEIKGSDARLAHDMNVKRHSDTSSLLDLEDALRQMKEVHRRFLHDGRIEP